MDFKIGDVVELKSGSPSMTVSDFGRDYNDDPNSLVCVWFQESSRQQAFFDYRTLKLIQTD